MKNQFDVPDGFFYTPYKSNIDQQGLKEYFLNKYMFVWESVDRDYRSGTVVCKNLVGFNDVLPEEIRNKVLSLLSTTSQQSLQNLPKSNGINDAVRELYNVSLPPDFIDFVNQHEEDQVDLVETLAYELRPKRIQREWEVHFLGKYSKNFNKIYEVGISELLYSPKQKDS